METAARKKRALVLGGGGSRGAYEIGVWQALREMDWQFDIVTGTSVGSINGAIFVTGEFDVAVEVWKRLDNSMVFNVELDESVDMKTKTALVLKKIAGDMVKTGGGDGARLRELLTTYINEEKVRKSPVDYGLATVDISEMKLCEMTKEEIPEGKMVDYILASASIFPAVRPQKIDTQTYVDGGLFEQMPIDLAIRMGAEDIIAIELDGTGLFHKTAPEGVRERLLKPKWDLGSVFVFDTAQVGRSMRFGYLDGMKLFGVFDGEYYAFIKNTWLPLFKARRAKFNKLCDACAVNPTAGYRGFLEKKASDGLKNALRQRGVSGTKYESVMLCAAEFCGEIFGLDPTVIYSAERFTERLEEKVIGYSVEIRKVLRRQKNGLPEMLKMLSRELRTVILGRLLTNNLNSGKPYSFAPVAALMPNEFLAALFVATVINNDVYVEKENALLQECGE